MKALLIKCPQCSKQFEYFSSTFRPFCCEKCKMSDLGHWLTESYVVSRQMKEEEIQQLEIEQNEEDFALGEQNNREGEDDEQA